MGLLCVLTGGAAAAATEAAPLHYGEWGGVGVYRVDSARPLPSGHLVIGGGASYGQTRGMFDTDELNTRQVQSISFTYSPGYGLELFLVERAQTNRNAKFAPKTTQSLGDPRLGVKYGMALSDTLHVGAVVDLLLPTSRGGVSLSPKAFRLGSTALATLRLADRLHVSLNLGYVLDNSGQLFGEELSQVQRFGAQLSDTDLVVVGLGANSDLFVGELFGLAAFAEVTAGFATVSNSNNPVLATFGLKAFPGRGGLVELALGTDVRLAGAPAAGAPLPGLAQWEAFARLTVNIRFRRDKSDSTGPVACTPDAVCAAGLSCVTGMCMMMRTAEGAPAVQVAPPTFTIRGSIVDAETKEPVAGATAKIVGGPSSALAADPKTGEFLSHELLCGEGLVQVKVQALGYVASEQTIPRGASGSVIELAFKLRPQGKDATGELRGSLKDSRTGKAVRGQIFVPALSKRLRVEKGGKFSGSLRAGRHQVLVSARGYETQRKEITIRAGEVVILNLDMTRQR